MNADIMLIVGFVGSLALMIATAFFIGIHLSYTIWHLDDYPYM
jgi:hypothetical protein